VAVIDGLLAPTAMEHELTLVTRNTRDVAATGVSYGRTDIYVGIHRSAPQHQVTIRRMGSPAGNPSLHLWWYVSLAAVLFPFGFVDYHEEK
jgi:hypothetical protein